MDQISLFGSKLWPKSALRNPNTPTWHWPDKTKRLQVRLMWKSRDMKGLGFLSQVSRRKSLVTATVHQLPSISCQGLVYPHLLRDTERVFYCHRHFLSFLSCHFLSDRTKVVFSFYVGKKCPSILYIHMFSQGGLFSVTVIRNILFVVCLSVVLPYKVMKMNKI